MGEPPQLCGIGHGELRQGGDELQDPDCHDQIERDEDDHVGAVIDFDDGCLTQHLRHTRPEVQTSQDEPEHRRRLDYQDDDWHEEERRHVAHALASCPDALHSRIHRAGLAAGDAREGEGNNEQTGTRREVQLAVPCARQTINTVTLCREQVEAAERCGGEDADCDGRPEQGQSVPLQAEQVAEGCHHGAHRRNRDRLPRSLQLSELDESLYRWRIPQ
mmetsp:Transcript_106564/g.339916  ORF Transcript_106564/g.339916 Transcript_106564/m.339916 type:complete len:218 (-) Transcript_106564:483-1136(-)